MSLQLILGGSGTGKSTRLYQMIVERSVQFPDEKTLLIVPEQKTMQAQKNIVMHHPRHGVMNVDVLSFERLAYRIFEELGLNQKEILEDTGKSMIVRRILTEHEEELSAFRGNIRKKGFVDEVKSMLSELLQYGVTPDILRKRSMEMGTESVLYAKLQDITVIYEAFLDRIHEKYMTTEEVPDRLCDVIEQSDMIRRVHVFLDDFTGFTPIQYRLMTRILQLAPRVVMTLNVDVSENPYQTVSMEHLFYLPKDTIFQLERICRENLISRTRIFFYRRVKMDDSEMEELASLEKIFQGESCAMECSGEYRAYGLVTPNEEMGYAAMKIHEYVSVKNYRYRDIAVVASDMNLYRGSAQYWFDKYQIPAF
ncbi:MAG: PD-(D/E)XK nuclease family protein [Coprococcus sp.]